MPKACHLFNDLSWPENWVGLDTNSASVFLEDIGQWLQVPLGQRDLGAEWSGGALVTLLLLVSGCSRRPPNGPGTEFRPYVDEEEVRSRGPNAAGPRKRALHPDR